jgi:membrane fusion protein, heavy metal efflux system
MKPWLVWTMAFLLGACTTVERSQPDRDVDLRSETRWSDRTELFVEYPPLVAGRTARFAVHLTRLDTFQPMETGTVHVHLEPLEAGVPLASTVKAPSRPGIFGVDVTPQVPGWYRLTVIVEAPDGSEQHDLDRVRVWASPAEAEAAGEHGHEHDHGHEPGHDDQGHDSAPPVETIAFSKEQQWELDVATVPVTEATVRPSLVVPAEIVPSAGGEADVTAPSDGWLVGVGAAAVGTRVARGQELARLQPPGASAVELPRLRLDHQEAAAALDLARKDRERVERLADAGAVSGRRLDEALAAEVTANARFEAAEARLAEFGTLRTDPTGRGADGLFVLRSPVAGTLLLRHATQGAHVTAGSLLFRIVDETRAYVAGSVPESALSGLSRLSGAELRLPVGETPLALGRPVAVGRDVDPDTRTARVTYEVDARRAGLAIGQTVSLHLLLGDGAVRPVVPYTAVIDDGGRPVVFVQQDGEAFERRPVTLGDREGDLVQILAGLVTGERVVMRGGHFVRLATFSIEMPAHGHDH